MRVRADGALARVRFVAAARRMLGEAQPRLREREPEGLVALVHCCSRHPQAVFRVVAVNVVGTHVYAPPIRGLACNATSQPGQTRDPRTSLDRKASANVGLATYTWAAVAFHPKGSGPVRARQVLSCLRALAAQDGPSIAKQTGMFMFDRHAPCRAVSGYRGRSQLRPAHRS